MAAWGRSDGLGRSGCERRAARRLLGLLVGLGLLGAGGDEAQASGFDLPLLGPAGVGRGGAVTAGVDDLTALEINPARLARHRGTGAQLTWGPLYQQLRYRRAPLYDWTWATSTQPPPPVQYDEIENDSGLFALSGSFVSVASDLGLKDWTFAAALYGPTAEGKLHLPEDGAQRYQMVTRDVMMLYYALSAAWQVSPDLAIGGTLAWVDVPQIKLALVVDANNQTSTVFPDRSPYDVLVTLDAADRVGLTGTLGAWWRPWRSLELGLASRILPIPIDAEGPLKVKGVGDMVRGRTITTYRVEGSERVADDDATLSFSYAPSVRFGMRWAEERAEQPWWDLELDLTWEGWSVLDAYEVTTPPMARVEELGLDVPLNSISLTRNWEDTYSARLGGSLALLPGRLTGRLGGLWESAAVPSDYTYMDFFGFERFGVGGGLALTMLDGAARLELSYLHVFVEPRAVSASEGKMYQQRPGSTCAGPDYVGEDCDPHYPGQPGAVSNAGTYLVGYDLLSVGLALDWGRPAPTSRTEAEAAR